MDLPAEATNIAAGAKTEAVAAERREAAAETGRVGTAGAPPETTRSTGEWVKAAAPANSLLQDCENTPVSHGSITHERSLFTR